MQSTQARGHDIASSTCRYQIPSFNYFPLLFDKWRLLVGNGWSWINWIATVTQPYAYIALNFTAHFLTEHKHAQRPHTCQNCAWWKVVVHNQTHIYIAVHCLCHKGDYKMATVIMSVSSQTTVKLSTFWVIIPVNTSHMKKKLLAPQIIVSLTIK